MSDAVHRELRRWWLDERAVSDHLPRDERREDVETTPCPKCRKPVVKADAVCPWCGADLQGHPR